MLFLWQLYINGTVCRDERKKWEYQPQQEKNGNRRTEKKCVFKHVYLFLTLFGLMTQFVMCNLSARAHLHPGPKYIFSVVSHSNEI